MPDPTLAARIRDRLDEDKGTIPESYLAVPSLLLGLHTPDRHGSCRHDGYQHPCPTLTAIAEALGIKEES